MPDNILTSSPPDTQAETGAVNAYGPKTEGEWLTLAREAHSSSTSYFDAAVRNQLVADLRQFQGQHPSGSKYLSDAYRARSKFFRPKTRASVRKNEAIAAEAMFQTMDVLSVSAQDGDDPYQQASAEINKELLQYRLTTPGKGPPWFLIAMGAYQDAQVQGIVCSYQYWKWNRVKKVDQPCIELRPLENIRFDPSAHWYDPVGTSPYFIDMIPMYVKDVKARMTTVEENGEPRWKPMTDTQLLAASTGYSEVVRLQRQAGRIDPATQKSAITSYTIVWIHRNIVEVDGIDYVYHTLATQGLLDMPRPIEQVYFHGKRPYVVGFSVIETHKNYPGGSVRLTGQIQGELNQNANQRIDNVSFAMNKRYFVKRTAQVDTRSLLRNVPSSVTMMMDPEKDVKIVDTPDVTRSAYEEQDRLNLDFDDLAGSFSGASVQSNRKLNETVGGMNILTKDASQISGYQLRTFVETWAEPVLHQMVLLEQNYEDDAVVLALAAKKANLYQRFGVNTVTDDLLMQELTTKVNVGVGATNPHDQLQNFLTAMKEVKDLLADGVLVSFGVDVGEVFKEIFGKLGYRDGKRFFPSDQDPTVVALTGQVQQLKQALAAKQPPELIAAQVRKMQAEIGKIGVETQFSAVQTGEVLAAVPQVAPVADALLASAQNGNPLPQPPGTGAIGIEAVKNKRTGMDFTPGVATTGAPQNTHPNEPPVPASPGAGAAQGIETMRSNG